VSEGIVHKCDLIADGQKNKKSPIKNSKKYPRGWTGEIGVWEKYFSDKNKESYNSAMKRFLDYYPDAALLLDVYPDLVLTQRRRSQ